MTLLATPNLLLVDVAAAGWSTAVVAAAAAVVVDLAGWEVPAAAEGWRTVDAAAAAPGLISDSLMGSFGKGSLQQSFWNFREISVTFRRLSAPFLTVSASTPTPAMVWPLPRPWSETMVSIPLWAHKTLEIKGFLGLERPFLDWSRRPRAQAVGVDPFLMTFLT